MVLRQDLRVDVTAAVPDLPGGPHETAVTVIASETVWPPKVVLFGFPGGGYGRRYFDLQLDGHPGLDRHLGYSEAEHHAEHGWLVIACDHLGVGDSSLPDPMLLSFEVCAAANDATVRAVLDKLADGTLAPGLAAVADRPFVVGAGQSMGGCLTIVAQGLHHTFDAIAILGFSAIHTVLPTPSGEVLEGFGVARGEVGDIEASSAELHASQTFGYAFHLEDVPADIVAADLDGYPLHLDTPKPAWCSATMPMAALSMLTENIVQAEAAAIDVPVLCVAGERDVVPDIHAEPSAFRLSPDVTAAEMVGSAHMHNFATTRVWLWKRVEAWVDGLISTYTS